MIESSIAYLLLLATLVFFAWLGYRESVGKKLDNDEFLSARGSQNWIMIGLSLFASGMGVWILFGPSEVGYYGGFYDVMGYAMSSATPFLLLAYLGPLIRKLTPKECTRFQGFPEDFRFPEEMANSHCYKQAGNSVVVPVVKRIAEEMVRVLNIKYDQQIEDSSFEQQSLPYA